MNYFGKFDATGADALGQHPSAHLFSESIHATHVPSDAVVVSDAQLLFNAEFKRSGVDLVLSGDGREVVLHDYFKGHTRAPIASPDGAHLTGEIVTALAGEVQLAQADGSAGAHAVIGHVTKLVGSATAVRNGVSIILNNGDNVEKGDVVASGSDSTLGITFIDGTVFGLSSNARMVLNEMVYDPNGSNNSSLLSLVAGTITFVAGETAKHGDMKVDTPVATMGIRGTAVLVEIDFAVPAQNAQPGAPVLPDAKFQVLVEPDGTTGSYILFDKQTLTPLAVVDQAGTQINISNGILSQTLAPLSPEIQKLIQDVFTLKFSDNSNTKSFDHFTDVVIQLPLQPGQFPIGSTAAPFIPVTLNFNGNTANGNSATPPIIIPHLPGQLSIQANSGVLVERPNATGPSQDTITGQITFKDGNVTDSPTLSVTFSSFTYQDAKGNALTLSAQQLQTLETALSLSANPGIGNNGWTYSIPASALSSLAVGSTLTLNYNATVNNNYAPADETATAPFSITIKIAGEIWSETKEVASPAPGDWATGANWQSGVAPTASDDVIIVTDPAQSGTPFYPVTITSAAFADSVTMNNLSGISPGEDTNRPELDNHNTLTIGGGGLHLNADSILRNFGTISVGGIAEILQNSLLQNSGTMTLAQGGDFKGSSSITNSGTIELVHGTLNVEVDVANTEGTLRVDDGATLKLANGAVITQGEITLGASSVLDVEGAGGATLDGVTVTGTDGEAPSVVEVGVNTEGGSILTMEDGASIANGFMTIGVDSILDVGAGGATLDGVAATSFGTIEIGVGSEEGGSTLTLLDGTSVVGGHMTIAAESTLDIESALGATLAGVAVAADAASTIEIGANGSSILVLADGTSITNGNMAIGASSTLDVEGTEGAILDGVTVTGTNGESTSKIEIGALTISGSILILMDGTSITYGDMTIAANSTLDIESAGGATLNDVIVTNFGTIQVDGGDGPTVTFVLDGGTELIGGHLLIHSPLSSDEGVVEIEDGGATFDDVTVTNNNELIIDANVTLTLTDNTSILGGTIHDAGTLLVSSSSEIENATIDGGGDVTVTGGTLTLSDVTLDDVTLKGSFTNRDTLTINGTVTLDSATIDGGSLDVSGVLDSTGTSALSDVAITNSGTIDVVNGTLTIDPAPFTNTGTIEVDSDATLALSGETVSNAGGTIQVDFTNASHFGTFDLEGSTINGGSVKVGGVLNSTGTSKLHNVDITNSGTLESTGGGTLTIDATVGGPAVSNSGTLEANGGELDITGEPVTSTGTLQAISSSTLKLTSTTVTNTNGQVNDALGSTLDLAGSEIDNGMLVNGGTLNSTGASKLHNVGITNSGTLESTGGGTLTIDATVGGPAVSNSGTLEANGGELDITGEGVTNTGTLQAISSSTLKLTSTTVTNTNGQVNDALGSTLDLAGSEIDNGTLANGGTLNSTGASKLHNVGITNSGTLESTGGGTLTIDATVVGSAVSNSGTLEANGGELDITGEGVTNTGTLQAIDSSTLKLTSTTVTNTNGQVNVGLGSTLDLAGGEVDNGTLTNSGTLNSTGTSKLSDVAITNSGTLESTSGVLTISDPAGPAVINSGVLEANGGELDITGEPVTNTGTLQAIDSSTLKLTSTTVTNTNGKVNVDLGSTLDLVSATIAGGTIDVSGVVDSAGTSLVSGATIVNAGTIEVASGTLTIDPAPFTNTGTVIVDNGATLMLNGETVDNANGKFQTAGTGLIDLVKTTINSGTLGGRITTATGNTSSTLNGITLAVSSLVTATVGVLELTGFITNNGEFDAGTGATLDLDNTTVKGGILGGSGTIVTASGSSDTLNGVTISHGTTVTVADGTTLDLVGTITDSGTIALSSSGHATQVEISGNVSLAGGGSVTMTDNADNSIVSDGSAATLTNSDTISGAGTIGDSHLTLINNGTIDATGTHALIIDTSVTNNHGGLLEASAGSTLEIEGNVVNDGLIEAGSHAHVSITGNVTNTGTNTGNIEIFDHATVEIGGSVSAGQTVTFEQSNGAGLLVLDDSHDFKGTIVGLVEADTENAENFVDLKDLSFHQGSMSVHFSTTTHLLTISNSFNQDSVSLHVAVGSNFSNEFEIHSDGHGGTLLDDPSATGTNTIDSGDLLGISGASSATINFTNSSGNTGELLLNDSKDFTGTIVGFAGDGTIANSDLIDITDVNFADVATNKTTYTENADGTGTLTLYDANGQALDSIKFAGNYQLANFTVENDGNGGILIVDPPVNTDSQTTASTIVASEPNQTLSGSAPSDNFVFNFAAVGHSAITNFDPGADTIQFASSVFASVQSILDAVHDDGHGNSVIAIDAHDSITLNGVPKAQLHASDFHIV